MTDNYIIIYFNKIVLKLYNEWNLQFTMKYFF